MPFQLSKAIPLLLGVASAERSACDGNSGEFMCEDMNVHIITYNEVKDSRHFYLNGNDNMKGLNVVQEPTNSRMLKVNDEPGSRWYIQDQHGRYLQAHEKSETVDLTDRACGAAEWEMVREYPQGDTGGLTPRMHFHTSINDGWKKKKGEISFGDRETNVKLLRDGYSDGREWWFVEPAYCAVIDGDKIVGNWTQREDVWIPGVQHYKHGYELHVDTDIAFDFSAKLKAVMKGGFNMGIASKHVKVKAELAAELSGNIDVEYKTWTDTDFTHNWTDEELGGHTIHVWQFQVYMTDQGGDNTIGNCGQTRTMGTQYLIPTKGDVDMTYPCCLPGKFHDDPKSDTPWDTCINSESLLFPDDPKCHVRSQEEFTV